MDLKSSIQWLAGRLRQFCCRHRWRDTIELKAGHVREKLTAATLKIYISNMKTKFARISELRPFDSSGFSDAWPVNWFLMMFFLMMARYCQALNRQCKFLTVQFLVSRELWSFEMARSMRLNFQKMPPILIQLE